jgi:hypothetical protein
MPTRGSFSFNHIDSSGQGTHLPSDSVFPKKRYPFSNLSNNATAAFSSLLRICR